MTAVVVCGGLKYPASVTRRRPVPMRPAGTVCQITGKCPNPGRTEHFRAAGKSVTNFPASSHYEISDGLKDSTSSKDIHRTRRATAFSSFLTLFGKKKASRNPEKSKWYLFSSRPPVKIRGNAVGARNGYQFYSFSGV